MSCMMCKICDRANSNEKGEVWCEEKKAFVPLISPKCECFVHVFGKDEENDRKRKISRQL